MIRSFRDRETEAIFARRGARRFQHLAKPAYRKLVQLDSATQLNDLAALPGNRLEALKEARAGQHSIRINGQYRLCFRWNKGEAFDVEITDYHS